jgi:hypothetical protein
MHKDLNPCLPLSLNQQITNSDINGITYTQLFFMGPLSNKDEGRRNTM